MRERKADPVHVLVADVAQLYIFVESVGFVGRWEFEDNAGAGFGGNKGGLGIVLDHHGSWSSSVACGRYFVGLIFSEVINLVLRDHRVFKAG